MHYTPCQVRIKNVLADGNAHTWKELHGCLQDSRSSRRALQMQISKMRTKLRPQGQDIICELNGGRICYRQVQLLRRDDDDDDE